MGHLVYEGGDSFILMKMSLLSLRSAVRKRKTTALASDRPACNRRVIRPEGEETAHKGIIQNVINAILNGEKLIAPGPRESTPCL